jgi:hypothetical protein
MMSRAIISTVGQDGVTTYLVDGCSKRLVNRERRIALNNAFAQLRQLTAILRLPIAASDDKLASEGLGLLFNWLRDENERLTESREDQA